MNRVFGVGFLVAASVLGGCRNDTIGLGDATPDATAEAVGSDALAVDSTASETAMDADTAPLDASDDTFTDTFVDTFVDTFADTGVDPITDTTPDLSDPGPPPLSTCPVPSFTDLYPGPIPPFPYGDWPPADACLRQAHDVAIVLGCPSKSDGSPSDCQKGRALIADQLYEAGWTENFIVSGGAVHNQWNEAEALAEQLAARGIPADHIVEDRLAAHTDENMYYATRIMETHGWTTAFVISEDPGHLMMTALCDANCCVALGRMTLVAFPILGELTVKVGHYVLAPPGIGTSTDECKRLADLVMCINQASRKACKDDFQLE